MKTSIVIGGSGFIGRHVVNLLCEAGREVVALGRSSRANGMLHPACRYISGDYGDRALLKKVMTSGCEVIDLAYSTVPKTSYEDPAFDLLSNLPSSVGLFQEALDAGLARLLIVSSGGTVYGPTNQLPIQEDHPTCPVSPYGITKLTTDRYAMMFHRNNGLPVLVARPANAYGEDQRTGTGQGFIAAAIQAILSGREIEIYGVGGTIRDYLHVRDVAAGIVSILENGTDGEIYNLGTGVGTSNAEIVTLLEKLAARDGLTVRTKVLPSRSFDVEANVLDSSKLRNLCQWTHTVDVEEGVSSMWKALRGEGGRG
jgi:UDP-glucose 4-epimerase